MYTEYNAKHYPVSETSVTLETSDEVLEYVFGEGERICLDNIALFGETPVLLEGAKYNGVWLETQPMGGEMYASRNMEIALNNHLIFMKYQRRDGKLPGMITCSMPWRGIAPNHDWMQGDFFTRSALRMYYLIRKDKEYLSLLYETLRDFDDYLWKYRSKGGDGCLQTFCVWDTGDDNNTKLLSHGVHTVDHGLCFTETPPTDHGKLPFESAEYMAYSYSQRCVLAEISDILGNGEGEEWRRRARETKICAIERLYDKDKCAFFDRDKDGEVVDVLTLENLKCMYHGLFTQEMADEFIEKHLLNKDDFFTFLPLPNIAASDPVFYINDEVNNLSEEMKELIAANCSRDISNNSWGGPVQGLCYQRAIDALINYGHHAELTILGRKWIRNLAKYKKFPQQFNPFDGTPSHGESGYGPTALSALEYIAHLVGIDYASDRFTISSGVEEGNTEYKIQLFGETYLLSRSGGIATLYKNGETVFSFTSGVRVICDSDLNVLSVIGMECETVRFTLTLKDKVYGKDIAPNECCEIRGGELVTANRVRFDLKG